MPRYYYWLILVLLLVGCENMRTRAEEVSSIGDTKTYFSYFSMEENIIHSDYS